MTTMKERLAWIAYSDTSGHLSIGAWHSLDEQTKDIYRGNVDAMLRELKNPSEEMISAMMHGFHLNKAPRQAMHDALVNGLCFIETEKDEPQQEDDVA